MTQQLAALQLEAIHIQSGLGELLYAEIPFHHASEHPFSIQLASNEELNSLHIQHQPIEHLNFFVRAHSPTSGVITVTSSRPIIESKLNIVLKVQQGSHVHLQHIEQTLVEKFLTREQTLTPLHISHEDQLNVDLARTDPINAQPLSLQNTAPPPMHMTEQESPIEQVLKLNTHSPPSMRPVTRAADSTAQPTTVKSTNAAKQKSAQPKSQYRVRQHDT